MKNIVYSIMAFFGFTFTAHAAEKCVFDHLLVTLPSDSYLELKKFFSLGSNQEITGIKWKDDLSNAKGFAMFEDGSYLEVWDESKFNKWGYQEACRMMEKSSLVKIGKEFKSELGEFEDLAVVGRKGWCGDTQGGMFFIWQPRHIIDAKKNGIRQLLKLVEQNEKGEINSNLISDYKRAGLDLEFRNNKKVMIATDAVKMKRIAIASPAIKGNGFIALKFSRKDEGKDKITIQTNAMGTPTMFLDLDSKSGTLVLRADQYQQNSGLLK